MPSSEIHFKFKKVSPNEKIFKPHKTNPFGHFENGGSYAKIYGVADLATA
jgi:hypothetical protein